MYRDLGMLWEWEHDENFVRLLDSICYRSGKSSYIISHYNLGESISKIERGELKFRTILDRATDANDAFLPVLTPRQRKRPRIINDPESVADTICKAKMHIKLIEAGLDVPFTLIVSRLDNIEVKALDTLGTPFIIKPALGGGGEGVVTTAESIQDVFKARELDPEATILIQENVIPDVYKGTRCWFRVFFVCGKVIPCFWDDLSFVYKRLSSNEEKVFADIFPIMRKIQKICKLEFFSTEIAEGRDGRFVIIDYVNDQCDLRFQSTTPDGVPDSVIEEIASAIVDTL